MQGSKCFILLIAFALTKSPAYSAVQTNGVIGDRIKSVVYDAQTGEVSLEVPDGFCASAVEILSAKNLFTGPKPSVVSGLFDFYAPHKLFLLKPAGGIRGNYPIGQIMAPGIAESVLAEDLTLSGGACVVEESSFSDLVYIVPEPTMPMGLLLVLAALMRRREMGRGHSRLCAPLSFFLLLSLESYSAADIFRWDTGALIPGSQELVAQPDSDLGGRNLRYADFRATNLAHARFVESMLFKASFANANLSRARFQAAQLTGADFQGAEIAGAGLLATTPFGFTREQLYATSSYVRRDLSRVNLSANDLRDWDFSGQKLTAVDFSQSQLAGAQFAEAMIDGANLSGTTDLGFTLYQLYSTKSYQDGDLRFVSLSHNRMAGAEFASYDLSQADLSLSVLSDSDFTRAQLFGADLRGSNLANAKLTSANLAGARLVTASLVGANLDNAVLASVRITGRLSRASLRGANLSTSDLSGASLDGVVFDRSTVYDSWTLFPEGFDAAAHGLTYRESTRADYNGNGRIDAEDFDILSFRTAIRDFRESAVERAFDVNRDTILDAEDRRSWVVDVARTWHGDANLDGLFDRRDLLQVFAAGQYDLVRPFRAGWASGDWSGDGSFDADDLMMAFAEGGYGAGKRTVAGMPPWCQSPPLGLPGSTAFCSNQASEDAGKGTYRNGANVMFRSVKTIGRRGHGAYENVSTIRNLILAVPK